MNAKLINLVAIVVGAAVVALGAFAPLDADTRMQLVAAGMFLVGYGVKRLGDKSPDELASQAQGRE